jgi:hypothetical protein
MDHAPVPGYIDLSPGDLPAAFFDIVNEAMPVAKTESSDIHIAYVAAIEDDALPLGEYRLTLRAEGGGAAVRKTVVVRKVDARAPVVMREDRP